MSNLMQGHCAKVLKVSEQSTSVNRSVGTLDNGLICARRFGERGLWDSALVTR
jgi:hypothetical protein